MSNHHRTEQRNRWRYTPWLLLALLISGCEAPLDLTLVEREIQKPIYRFDQLKAAASNHRRIIAVGDYGTVLTSPRQGGDLAAHPTADQLLPGRGGQL